jgi:hypothetical protein
VVLGDVGATVVGAGVGAGVEATGVLRLDLKISLTFFQSLLGLFFSLLCGSVIEVSMSLGERYGLRREAHKLDEVILDRWPAR